MSNIDLRIYDPTKVRGLFDELRGRLDEATAENRRLREALIKCVDTFWHLEKTLRMLDRPVLADACAVALHSTRAVLEPK